jgi:hypothetical protein
MEMGELADMPLDLNIGCRVVQSVSAARRIKGRWHPGFSAWYK